MVGESFAGGCGFGNDSDSNKARVNAFILRVSLQSAAFLGKAVIALPTYRLPTYLPTYLINSYLPLRAAFKS